MLLQIHGEKELFLHDPSDPTLLPDRERELYYQGDLDAATYRPEHDAKAARFAMQPGVGVHLPVNAPHWIKNGANHSVSLSINLCLRGRDRLAKAYQVNHYLRKLGLEPTPPGRSALRDNAKILALELLSKRQPETLDEMLRSGTRRIHAVKEKSRGMFGGLLHRR